MIRAIGFDLDDTLCNYMEVADAAREWVFHLGSSKYPELTAEKLDEAWYAEFGAMLPDVREGGDWRARYLVAGETSRTELMRRTLRRLGIEDPALAACFSEGYYSERTKRLELYPDTIEVLDRLGKEWPLGMITNGPADTQRDEIARLGIGRRFKAILIEGEFGYGKPDARIFHALADQLGAKPSEMVFVGNSYHHDIVGARQAGFKTVFLDIYGSHKDDASAADFTARSLTEAADWIEAL